MLITLTLLSQDYIVQGIRYELRTSKECSVTGYEPAALAEDVMIPSAVDYQGTRYKVVEIRDNAFQENIKIKSVTIAEGVRRLGDRLFAGCYGLRRVAISRGPSAIGKHTFMQCTALETVALPEGLTTIGTGAFSGCEALRTIDLPQELTQIGTEAFASCQSLAAISLPSNLEHLGRLAFAECASVTSYTIAPSNPHYTSIDGVLFTKDQRTLLFYPGGAKETSYTVPQSVEVIGSSALARTTHLRTITLPQGLKKVSDRAFMGCNELRSLTIPEGATHLEDYALGGCYALERVALPSTIAIIGHNVLCYCPELKELSITLSHPPTVSPTMFDQTPINRATLRVPTGSEGNYRATAGWSAFGTIKGDLTSGSHNDTVQVFTNPNGVMIIGLGIGEEIFVYDTSGTNVKQLTTDSAEELFIPLEQGEYYVRVRGTVYKAICRQ